MNHVTLVGRLGKDPELKFLTGGSALCTFSVAVTKEWVDRQTQEKKQATTWVDCKAWREQAERIAEKFKKGASVCVTGELSVESWDDKTSGQKRSKMLVTANYVAPAFVGKKSESAAAPSRTAAPAPKQESLPESPSDDDVPF